MPQTKKQLLNSFTQSTRRRLKGCFTQIRLELRKYDMIIAEQCIDGIEQRLDKEIVLAYKYKRDNIKNNRRSY